jgi:integrase
MELLLNFEYTVIPARPIRRAIAGEGRFTPYATFSRPVKKAGQRVGVDMNPHDLRRHAATFASRSGTPIEIVSKVILRHAGLSTTQRYLGKVSDAKALRWIETVCG